MRRHLLSSTARFITRSVMVLLDHAVAFFSVLNDKAATCNRGKEGREGAAQRLVMLASHGECNPWE